MTRRSPSFRSILSIALAAVVAACADRVVAPSRVAPDPTSIATLVVRGSGNRPGSVVTLAAHLTDAAAANRTGAYLAHIEYDTSLVAYVGQGDAAGGIAAFHADGGVLRVAGASLDGYAGGVLFNVQFRVARASSQPELRLVIDELRDMNLRDRLPPQIGARSALLRPWR
jgi:hypothetical protein